MTWTKLPARLMKGSVWENIGQDQGFVDEMKDDGAFSQLEKLFAKVRFQTGDLTRHSVCSSVSLSLFATKSFDSRGQSTSTRPARGLWP